MEADNNINKESIKEEEKNNDINTQENNDDKEVTEKEIKEIIDYISTWTVEKYEKDHEIREALQLLKNKMIKEEKEKENRMNELRRKEGIVQETDINKDNNIKEKQVIFKEDEKIKTDNVINDNKNNEEVFKDNLDDDQKKILEKTWNKSTKPEFGEKIINEKGDKEIITTDDKDKKIKKKVRIYILYN